MKVYVDFEDLDEKTFTDNALIYINRKKDIDYVEQIKIQSLADYTKQVRKEVCENIKEKLRKQYPTVYANIGESLFCSDCYLRIRELSEILDQIQGEING